MMKDMDRIAQVRAEGLCCAQTLVQLGLDWRGEENEQLVQAVGGLCGGLSTGKNCGALTGAICMLSMFGLQLARSEMIPEMVEWFAREYGGEQGNVNCLHILGGDMQNRHEICPALIQNTYLAAKDILLLHGFEMGGMLED